jgi:hypothetical protein
MSTAIAKNEFDLQHAMMTSAEQCRSDLQDPAP